MELRKKGAMCSINGKKYEQKIYNIVKNCQINKQKFNTQDENELGGSSLKNDILCNYNDDKNIGIEIKKYKTPDWMQCGIKYDFKEQKWKASSISKISQNAKNIFEQLIENIILFDNKIPPFIEQQLTYKEWIQIKQNTDKWNDIYKDIPNDTIQQLYKIKGCQYIQISDGYGLYHLGKDVCNFNVPPFIVSQQLRIRIKVHTKKNKKGYCKLSVTVSCQPKNIKTLQKSNFSLDDKNKLPNNLIYL